MSSEGERLARPKLVWAIVIFNCFGIAFSCFSLIAYAAGWIPIEDRATRDYLAHISILEWLGSGFLLLLKLAATVALFSMRAIAAPLYTALLAISVTWTAFSPAPGQNGVFTFSIAFAICLYLWHLKRRGLLRDRWLRELDPAVGSQ